MNDLAVLLADCDALGIRLHSAGDGSLTIDTPASGPGTRYGGAAENPQGPAIDSVAASHNSSTPTHADGELHGQAGMPVRFNGMARCTNSQWAICPTGLRTLWAVLRFSTLAWKGCWTNWPASDRITDMMKKRTDLMTDQLRQAIDDCGLTRYEIAKQTGIDESALAKFYNGHRGLSMEALNALGEFLQLTITLGRKPETKGK